jgi:hypothetical protein
MNTVRFNGLNSNNQPVQTQRQAMERETDMKIYEPPESSSKFFSWLKKWWWIIVLILIIIVVVVVVVACVVLKSNDDPETPIDKPIEILPPGIDPKKTEDVFSSMFTVLTKEKTLSQLSQKSYQNYKSRNNGETTSNSFLNEAIFDIYPMNSTSSSNATNIFYSKIYNTIITVKSFCSKTSSNPEKDECQLERQLDLNVKDQSNLRRDEEDTADLIKKAILPICIVEHTDRNLVISITCPETLDPSYKADIIRAFSNIKPNTMKGFEFDKDYVNTISEEKEDKIYTTSYDNVCPDPNLDPQKQIICNMTKNIITDKEGNLISSKITNSTNTTIDENNSFSNNFTYVFTNIPKENSESFDEETYQKNLETILSLTSSFMKKEIFIENMTNFAIELMEEIDQPTDAIEVRNLMEQKTSNPGVQE